MEKLFGGNPVGVIIRLLVLSLIVGITLTALGIHPQNILYYLQLFAYRIYNLGFGVFELLFGYLLIGAVIVVPVWLIVRLVSSIRSSSNDPGP